MEQGRGMMLQVRLMHAPSIELLMPSAIVDFLTRYGELKIIH